MAANHAPAVVAQIAPDLPLPGDTTLNPAPRTVQDSHYTSAALARVAAALREAGAVYTDPVHAVELAKATDGTDLHSVSNTLAVQAAWRADAGTTLQAGDMPAWMQLLTIAHGHNFVQLARLIHFAYKSMPAHHAMLGQVPQLLNAYAIAPSVELPRAAYFAAQLLAAESSAHSGDRIVLGVCGGSWQDATAAAYAALRAGQVACTSTQQGQLPAWATRFGRGARSETLSLQAPTPLFATPAAGDSLARLTAPALPQPAHFALQAGGLDGATSMPAPASHALQAVRQQGLLAPLANALLAGPAHGTSRLDTLRKLGWLTAPFTLQGAPAAVAWADHWVRPHRSLPAYMPGAQLSEAEQGAFLAAHDQMSEWLHADASVDFGNTSQLAVASAADALAGALAQDAVYGGPYEQHGATYFTKVLQLDTTAQIGSGQTS